MRLFEKRDGLRREHDVLKGSLEGKRALNDEGRIRWHLRRAAAWLAVPGFRDTVPEKTPPRGRILVAADLPPLFDLHAGGLRLHTLIGMMTGAGWRVSFGSIAARKALPGVVGTSEGRRRYEDALRAVGVTQIFYGSQEIDDFLVRSGRQLDWAFLSFPGVASELMPLVRCRCPTTRIAFDMVDFHGVRMAREAQLRGDAVLLKAAEEQRAIELCCAAGADVTLAVTPEEKVALREMLPEAAVDVLPCTFELPNRSPSGPDARKGLLFVGGFWHKPNGDAMLWFVEKIWPIIQSTEPSARLTIAGSNPSEDIIALGARPGIEVLGYVEDLTPLFDAHRAFVAPLRFGAGMKGKVAQAMINGLPVVATSIGAEGMGLIDETHVLIADEEEAFAAQVLRLLKDDALWSRFSNRAFDHIKNNFSTEVVGKQLEAVLCG